MDRGAVSIDSRMVAMRMSCATMSRLVLDRRKRTAASCWSCGEDGDSQSDSVGSLSSGREDSSCTTSA